jgi:peptidoglycan L-alanyl-D-glutamate endopeptidase CwlK
MTFDERTEKNLATLLPKAAAVARVFLQAVAEYLEGTGVVAKVISGTRTYAEQNALYAQGRTAPGRIVTKARGGYSNHNFGVAFDIGLFHDGKYLDESPIYRKLGPIGEAAGLEWGGRWAGMTDEPHYQIATGLTLAQLRDYVARGLPIL